MRMYRAVPKDGFDAEKRYAASTTRRTPSNVPYLVDNIWEWLRPSHAPSRRHAAYASPTPELALANASAVGPDPSLYVVCEISVIGAGLILAHLQVPDARVHADISRIVRLVANAQGPNFADMPIGLKALHAPLYMPAVAEAELDEYLTRSAERHELASELSRVSTFWQDASYDPQPHNGELFFQLRAGATYTLKPV